jgi:hypothetical protein
VHRVECDTRVARDLAPFDDFWNSTLVHIELIDHGQLSPLPEAARKPRTRDRARDSFCFRGPLSACMARLT